MRGEPEAFTSYGKRVGDRLYLWGDDSEGRPGTLFAVYGFFILSCVGAFINVVEQAQNPLWYNVLAYLVFMPALITAVGYTLADKRRLKKRHPQLARLKLWHLLGLDILMVMILICMAIMNRFTGDDDDGGVLI